MTRLSRLTLVELKLFLREPLGAFTALAFPALLVVILGLVPPFRQPSSELGGLRVIDLYVPITVTFALSVLALVTQPAALAAYRERGVLRRLATTPVGPVALLAAQLAMSLLVAVVTTALVLAVGRIGFDVVLPRQPVGFAVAFVLGAGGLFGIGLLVAALAPTGRAAQGIGSVLMYPMLFFAGLWLPRATMPHLMQRIGDFTPLGATVQALHDTSAGAWPQPLHLAVMASYLIVFGLIAARRFRWQ